jgi:hypothetical protein
MMIDLVEGCAKASCVHSEGRGPFLSIRPLYMIAYEEGEDTGLGQKTLNSTQSNTYFPNLD